MYQFLTILASHSSGKLGNAIYFIAILAILISIFSLSYSFFGKLNLFMIILGIIEVIILLYYCIIILTNQKKVGKQMREAENGYNKIFKIHFEYAKRK